LDKDLTGSLPAHEVLPQGRTPVLQGGEASHPCIRFTASICNRSVTLARV